jgi:hypothetical protein
VSKGRKEKESASDESVPFLMSRCMDSVLSSFTHSKGQNAYYLAHLQHTQEKNENENLTKEISS